jgi:DNA-binding transcriptional MerR regulator
MIYKPKEIAQALNVSTSTLRHYESWGIVPTPKRTKKGYRIYTEIHFAYFRFIRTMYPTFNMRFISKVLNYVQDKDIDQAFWLITEAQTNLNQQKKVAEETFKMLNSSELLTINSVKWKDKMTIGQIAEEVNVASSAIRHWEKKGLIDPIRSSKNGYHLYTSAHLRQILLIRTLRNTSYLLETIKNIIKDVKLHNMEQAKKITKEAMKKLNHRNRSMMNGIYELYRLCELLRY